MLTSDVRVMDGILGFVVSGDESGKRLKTAASRRIVPLHSELRKLGFASYLHERRQNADVQLFPATPMSYIFHRTHRQYIVIAAGGNKWLGSKIGEYIVAFTSP